MFSAQGRKRQKKMPFSLTFKLSFFDVLVLFIQKFQKMSFFGRIIKKNQAFFFNFMPSIWPFDRPQNRSFSQTLLRSEAGPAHPLPPPPFLEGVLDQRFF